MGKKKGKDVEGGWEKERYGCRSTVGWGKESALERGGIRKKGKDAMRGW
jgi:hypothetical protein